MTSEQELLLDELQETQEQLAKLNKQLEHRPEFGLGVGSPAIATWEMNLARRAMLERRIDEIGLALERKASGEYGLCEVCNKPIGEERLLILPHTRRCIRCANIPPGTRLRSPKARS